MPTRCLACNAVIETEPTYYRGEHPVCSQACAATKEVHPAQRPITHTKGPLAASQGNTGDHAYYVAAGRLDEKSGMTFFDQHVAWVTRKEDAELFARAEKMAETLQWIVDCGDAGEGGRPAYHDMRAKAGALLREIKSQ